VNEGTEACAEPPPPELIRGIDEFNRRAFYECHETIEALWMRERRPVRELYQGIIHLERGNYIGAVRTMRRGLERLAEVPSVCHSVQVGELARDTERALERVLTLGPSRLSAFQPELIPVIRLAEPA
jgi:predicted metal-dependent hydrolase